jgi:hypothetical protein
LGKCGKYNLFSKKLNELRRTNIKGEVIYYSLSFDIGKYDGGAFWLQVYNEKKQMVFDEPFGAPWETITINQILKRIKEELPFIEWP